MKELSYTNVSYLRTKYRKRMKLTGMGFDILSDGSVQGCWKSRKEEI